MSLRVAVIGAGQFGRNHCRVVRESLEEARRAYEASDYGKAIEVLEEASAREPKNGDIQLLLAKSYLELQQHDAAIRSAEKAVALDPENSLFHEWLGRAYGDKADRAGWFSAISLAKKTRKEFLLRGWELQAAEKGLRRGG